MSDTHDYRVQSIRRSERPKVSAAGRVCAVPGCGTVLSRYNPDSTCLHHQKGPSPRRRRVDGGDPVHNP